MDDTGCERLTVQVLEYSVLDVSSADLVEIDDSLLVLDQSLIECTICLIFVCVTDVINAIFSQEAVIRICRNHL